jgi:hypothetical protein
MSTAVACTSPAPKPKIAWNFTDLTYQGAFAGASAGGDATFTYVASHVPAGDSILLQKASVSGGQLKWRTVSDLQVAPVGTSTVIRPPLGRNAYRIAVVDGKSRVLASAPHNLDVYKSFTFAELTTRPIQTVKLGNGLDFTYVFQAEIFLEHTSCRSLGEVDLFNKGTGARQFRVTDTVGNATASRTSAVPASTGSNIDAVFVRRSVTVGEDLDLHILNNATLGTTIYGNGSATCFTDTGTF